MSKCKLHEYKLYSSMEREQKICKTAGGSGKASPSFKKKN